MTFPHFHSEFGKSSLKRAAELAITSHGEPEHRLSDEAIEMRNKRTHIELSGPGLAFLQHDMIEKIDSLKAEISKIERSVRDRTAPNESLAKDELGKLRQKLDFLEHNFAEELFVKTEDADNEMAI